MSTSDEALEPMDDDEPHELSDDELDEVAGGGPPIQYGTDELGA